MPIPNRVYPGDLYAIGNMVGSSINGLGADDSSLSERNVWRTWRTATSCFKALKGPEVLQLTKVCTLYASVSSYKSSILGMYILPSDSSEEFC